MVLYYDGAGVVPNVSTRHIKSIFTQITLQIDAVSSLHGFSDMRHIDLFSRLGCVLMDILGVWLPSCEDYG